MNLFVHIDTPQGPTATATLEQHWGVTCEPVARAPGLLLMNFDAFGPSSAPGQDVMSQTHAFGAALKTAFSASEVVETGPAEFELYWGEVLVTAMMRKQGLVLMTQDGSVAAANWPQRFAAAELVGAIERGMKTLAAARV